MKKGCLFVVLSVVSVFAQAQKMSPAISLVPAADGLSEYVASADMGELRGNNAVMKAAAMLNSYEGEYDWTYYPFMPNDNGSRRMYMQTVDESTGEMAIFGWAQNYVVKAFINYESKTLSIPNNQNLGTDSYGDINYFYVKQYDENGNAIPGKADVEATVGTIDGKTITFPRRDVWAIGDYRNENLGYWECSAVNVLTYNDPNEGWTDFGTATLIDGWVLPGYNMTPSEYPWQVDVQINDNDHSMLRLKNPYQADGFPRTKANSGYIQFCIADPEFVIVYPDVYSGYDNKQDKLYLFNLEGYYIMKGYTKDEIVASFKSGVNAFSTYSNGVATIQNCCFDIKAPATQRYRWQDKNGNVLTDMMVSTITIDKLVGSTDAADIMIDENNGTPEYYNMQGMRVINPEKNQLVIRYLNGKATKVIIK